jgi:hypothetical protein
MSDKHQEPPENFGLDPLNKALAENAQSELSPAHGSADLLVNAEKELYTIASGLGALRDKLAYAAQSQAAWEIEQTLRALREAVRAINRAKVNEPLPSVEDVQEIYRQNNRICDIGDKE